MALTTTDGATPGPVPVRQGAGQTDFDVAIIGLGPVGAVLACLLGQRGLRVLALDQAAAVYDRPRAIGMDQEALRLLQEIGIADRLGSLTAPYRDSEYRTASGQVIRRFTSPPAPHPLGWPPYVTFIQPELEQAIRDRAAALPGVVLRTSCRADGFDDTGTHVSLRLSDLTAAGDGETITCRYLVGADGGASPTRKALGIRFEDLVFDEPWLVVDLFADPAHGTLPEVNVQFCDPARPHTFVVGPGRLRRFEFMLRPGEDPATMAGDDSVWRLLAPWLTPDTAQLWRAATYRFHALVAERWRQGRVLLAGDACHMTPPFLAQGMVQGLKDAANLAWKLAAVCRGADDALLQTYEAERRPLVREVIALTKSLGEIICEQDPARAAARDARMARDMAEGRGTSQRQDLFPPLPPGPLVRAGDAAAGRPAPQPRLWNGDRLMLLDDLAGPGFALLLRAGQTLPPALRQRLDRAGIPCLRIGPGLGAFREEAGVFDQWTASRGLSAVLMRPDRMVLAGLADIAELPALLDRLAGTLQPGPRAPEQA